METETDMEGKIRAIDQALIQSKLIEKPGFMNDMNIMYERVQKEINEKRRSCQTRAN